MEIYENPACYEEVRAIYEVDIGGEGCKTADRGYGRRRGVRSRSPANVSHLKGKYMIEDDKVCFHPRLGTGAEE